MSKKRGFLSSLFRNKKPDDCCNKEIRKKIEKNCGCAEISYNVSVENTPLIESAMSIKVLGSGCKSCVTLTENTKLALEQMNIQANIEKITDLATITTYGVMSTPALVVNDKVVSYGKVLKPNEIIKILEKIR